MQIISILFVVSFYLMGALNYAQSGIVTDYDKNNYNIVKIGNQVWLKEDLKSLHYADGSVIQGTTAYNREEGNVKTYGRLYTWYAAMKDSNIEGSQGACPNGWHLPTDSEWSTLTNHLGGENIAGGHLKEAGTLNWNYPNTGADNSSGFTALPSGVFFNNSFNYLGYNVEYWTSSNSNTNNAFFRILYHDMQYVTRTDYFDKSTSRSIRCIKNEKTSAKKNESDTIPEKSSFLLQNYPNPFNLFSASKYLIETTVYQLFSEI